MGALGKASHLNIWAKAKLVQITIKAARISRAINLEVWRIYGSSVNGKYSSATCFEHLNSFLCQDRQFLFFIKIRKEAFLSSLILPCFLEGLQRAAVIYIESQAPLRLEADRGERFVPSPLRRGKGRGQFLS
jgi:hypothetical protein